MLHAWLMAYGSDINSQTNPAMESASCLHIYLLATDCCWALCTNCRPKGPAYTHTLLPPPDTMPHGHHSSSRRRLEKFCIFPLVFFSFCRCRVSTLNNKSLEVEYCRLCWCLRTKIDSRHWQRNRSSSGSGSGSGSHPCVLWQKLPALALTCAPRKLLFSSHLL